MSGGFKSSRSALAALNLKKMGFRNVLSLAGGYRGWHELETR
jgi:rhodanese-related sulfurtransferase